MLLPVLQLDSAKVASRHRFRDEAAKDPMGLKARVQKVTSEMAGDQHGGVGVGGEAGPVGWLMHGPSWLPGHYTVGWYRDTPQCYYGTFSNAHNAGCAANQGCSSKCSAL